MGTSVSRDTDENFAVKVIFCGKHFEGGFMCTKQALASDSTILVKQCHTEDLETEVVDCHVIVPLMTKITRDIMEKASNLVLIMQFGVGLEGIDIEAATSLGIAVSMIPSDGSGNAQSCAEHSIYLALSLWRQQKVLSESIKMSRLGYPTGKTFFGSSALIFGFGNIGRQLAHRLASFGLKRIVCIKREPWTGALPDGIDEIGTLSDLTRLASGIDALFICSSQNKENMGIIGKSLIDVMNDRSIIVNIARGGLLNYDDATEGLSSGKLAGVGIDVFHTEPFPPSDPFLNHPLVISTPHIAGVTEISYKNMSMAVAENVRRMMKNEQILNVVNFSSE